MEAEKTATQKVSEGALLMLDAERVVTFKDGKFPYTYYLSRLMQPDWEQYFSGIVYTTRNVGKAKEQVLDTESAALELVERKLVRVEGYRGDFMQRSGWQQRMPPRHVRPVSLLLRAVAESEEQADRVQDPDATEVLLDTPWGMQAPGKMALYTGLVHRFGPVTVDHKKRFLRAGSLSRVVGGSRNGLTIHGTRHTMLLRIYDELIQSVEGYGEGGAPLRDREHICRAMDAYHKVRAAEQLFTGSEPEGEDPEQE